MLRRTCADTAYNGADEMRVEHFQCIVHLSEQLRSSDHIHRDPRDGARAQPEEDSAPASYDTGSGCNGDESRNHTLHGSNDGWAFEEDDIHDRPGEKRHGRTNVGVQHRDTSVRRSGIGISSVEAVPPRPEDTGSDEHERHVRWRSIHAIFIESRTDPPRAYEPCRAGGQVDDIATGIIDDAVFEQESTAPDAESTNGIGEREP